MSELHTTTFEIIVLTRTTFFARRRIASSFVTILTRCVKRSMSDEVVILAIRSLGYLLKQPLDSVALNRGVLASGSLRVLTKGGIGGSRDELVQGIFKVLTFLFKGGDGSSLMLNAKQLKALVSLLRATVADTQHHNNTFGLIAALVSRKVVNVEMYDLMDDVLDLTVQSTNGSVRSLAISTFVSFILNYELGEKKIESLLVRCVSNCKVRSKGFPEEQGFALGAKRRRALERRAKDAPRILF